MEDKDLQFYADHIWSLLNTIENSAKSKEEQIELIKPVILEIAKDMRSLGRHQVINHMKDEIYRLQR